MTVDASTVLQGALLSLQQAGLLALEASAALSFGRYLSAASLAATAFELLEQHQRLLELWRAITEGAVKTVDEIRTELRVVSDGRIGRAADTVALKDRWHRPRPDAPWTTADVYYGLSVFTRRPWRIWKARDGTRWYW